MTSSAASTPSSNGNAGAFRFGPFVLDVRAAELRRDGEVVTLQPQPFKVLAALVARAGELVTREELQQALWGRDTYVDFERGLNFCVSQVRAALGDAADAPVYIQTLPRRGYRFLAPVTPDSNRGQTPSGSNRGQTPLQGRLGARGRTGTAWHAVAAGVGLLAILAAGAAFLARRATTPPAAPARTTIAVLPLDDLSGDQSSWFADGLTEELIAQLGRVSPERLTVIARTSALTYRGSLKSVPEIARELGASHLLEGSVRRDGDRLRITLQLVAAASQTPVWSETFDRTLHGALTLQTEVSARVASALALELLDAPRAGRAAAATRSPDARDAYLRGRYLWNRGRPGDFRAALEQFNEAVRLDPGFAAALAAQADTYHRLAMFGHMMPADAYPPAARAAGDAVRLDPDLADAHTALGMVQLWAEWNPAAAAASLERAIALNPSDAAAHHDLAWAFAALGRFDDAAHHITRARELDPVSPRASSDSGWLYLHIRRPADAVRACRQTLVLEPESVEAQQCLERAHLQRGEITEALAAARAAARHARRGVPAALDDPGPPETRLRLLWRARLDAIRTAADGRSVGPYTIAMHHAVLGEADEALARLEQAHASKSGMIVLLPTDPLFEPLRADPRFVALLGRIRAGR